MTREKTPLWGKPYRDYFYYSRADLKFLTTQKFINSNCKSEMQMNLSQQSDFFLEICASKLQLPTRANQTPARFLGNRVTVQITTSSNKCTKSASRIMPASTVRTVQTSSLEIVPPSCCTDCLLTVRTILPSVVRTIMIAMLWEPCTLINFGNCAQEISLRNLISLLCLFYVFFSHS